MRRTRARKAILIAAATSAVLALLPWRAGALWCNGRVTQIVNFYIDNRGGRGDVWIYMESNGTEGLQSGGQTILGDLLYQDPCEQSNPDTLIL